ncbi:hypothetical protein [Microbulbifer sp. TRSA007]|uniref:hypothetical protein n=1 Tax=Microbulbifer sp. TRSA007 TaxID=3243384 RepID=UPI0040397C48
MALKKFSTEITSANGIFGIIGVLAAIGFGAYGLSQNNTQPELEVRLSNISDTRYLHISNSGNSTCLDLKISYNDVFSSVYSILNYEESSISNASASKGVISVPARARVNVAKCTDKHCVIEAGSLLVDKTYTIEVVPWVQKPLGFPNGDPKTSEVTVSCGADYQKVSVPLHA